jgi:hypothetical protein
MGGFVTRPYTYVADLCKFVEIRGLFLPHLDQHRPDHQPAQIRIAVLVIELAGDQGNPVEILVLQHAQIGRPGVLACSQISSPHCNRSRLANGPGRPLGK